MNPNTFLYNTGPITSLDDPDLNVRQHYSVTEVRGRRRTGTATVLAEDLPSPPVNVGMRSTPNYADLGECTPSKVTARGCLRASATTRSSSISAARSTCWASAGWTAPRAAAPTA